MSRRTQKNVGVIGLGIIGQRVAENLRRRGFHVFVWNRTPRPFPNFVGSPAEVAQLCDFVQIFVSDDDALLDMVRAMKQSLKAHHVVMAHSTVAPHTMRAAAELVHRRGAQFLDAPFTGSKIPAEKGELVYYVAGDDAAFRRARPVLEASSKEIIEIGEIGQATTIKIATNMVTAASVQGGAEALALVHNSGISPEKFAAAMRGNASNSSTLSIKLPKMIEGDFEPHFSVKHMLKDVQIASRMARSQGLAFGALEAARESLLAEAAQGRGEDDFCSLSRSFFPATPPAGLAKAADEEQATLVLEERREAEAASQVDEQAAAEVTEQLAMAETNASGPEEEVTDKETEDQPQLASASSDETALTRESDPAEMVDVPENEEVAAGAPAEPITTQMEESTGEAASEPEAAALETQEAVPAATEEEPRRGFFSRWLGKGLDY